MEIMQVLQDLNAGGMTIVLITHETDIARYAGRTIILRDGRIVEDCAVPVRHRAADDLLALPAELRLPGA
jgi:putative ABC transport system ATP-binding protein